MKKLIFILILFCFFCPGIAYGADEHAAALGLYNKGKFAEALQMLQAHLLHNPGDLNGHYYIANCYLKLGERQKALKHYYVCITTSPDSKLAEYSRAAINSLGLPVEGPAHLVKPDQVRTNPDPVRTNPDQVRNNPDPHSDPIHARADSELQRQVSERQALLERERQAKLSSLQALPGRKNYCKQSTAE